jgi:NTP pyrophosphatase (non-canonical NTP hydrolase)
MTDLDVLQRLVLQFRDERDWQQFHNPKDMAISLVLEATEFMEHFQWKNADEIKRHLADRKEEIEDELADVLFWVLIIAHDFEIDIDRAFRAKLEKSAAKYPVEKAKGRHTKYTEL